MSLAPGCALPPYTDDGEPVFLSSLCSVSSRSRRHPLPVLSCPLPASLPAAANSQQPPRASRPTARLSPRPPPKGTLPSLPTTTRHVHHRPRQSGTTPPKHHPGLPYACPLRCIIAPPLSSLPARLVRATPPSSSLSTLPAVRADRSCPAAVAPHALAPSTPGHSSFALHHPFRSLPVTLRAAAIATAA